MNKLILIIFLCGVSFIPVQTKAQLFPFGSSYFNNNYLVNPAMAGLENNLKINAGYRKQADNDFDNAPVTMHLTGDYRFMGNNAAGLTVISDRAGMLRTNELKGSYAYHLPLSQINGHLHLGFSAGITQYNLDLSESNGEADDPTLLNYKDRGIDFNADFGAGYSSDKLVVHGALPNLVNFFKKDYENTVDRSLFYTSARYKITNSKDNDLGIEPIVVFRGFKGYDHMFDAGAKFSFDNERFYVFGLYHSTKNMSAGFGLELMKTISLNGTYFSASSDLKNYNHGNFEIGLRFICLSSDK